MSSRQGLLQQITRASKSAAKVPVFSPRTASVRTDRSPDGNILVVRSLVNSDPLREG